jgi:hypothetical protein
MWLMETGLVASMLASLNRTETEARLTEERFLHEDCTLVYRVDTRKPAVSIMEGQTLEPKYTLIRNSVSG